jgi:hypothetical protein
VFTRDPNLLERFTQRGGICRLTGMERAAWQADL